MGDDVVVSIAQTAARRVRGGIGSTRSRTCSLVFFGCLCLFPDYNSITFLVVVSVIDHDDTSAKLHATGTRGSIVRELLSKKTRRFKSRQPFAEKRYSLRTGTLFIIMDVKC